MQRVIWFSVFLGISLALNCHSGFNGEQRNVILCQGQCYKYTLTNNGNDLVYYGCDDHGTSYCQGIKNGKCETTKSSDKVIKETTCCCGTDLCNSSVQYLPFLALMAIVFSSFY